MPPDFSKACYHRYMAKTCENDDCDKPVQARDMCAMHYARWSRSYREAGLPLPPKPPREHKEPERCSIESCENQALARSWCAKHYWRWQNYGNPEQEPVRTVTVCTIDDCDLPARGHGLCSKHYTRQRRNGDPLVVQQIRGDDRARFESYVDRSGGPDACHPWTGARDDGGYGTFKIQGRSRPAHIVAWELERDPTPPGVDLDHECHNRAVRNGACVPGICEHRLCCNLAHVAAKARADHRADTEQWEMPTGLRPRLDEAQKAMIRDLLAAGYTGRSIAQQFGIHPATVTHIKLGRR